MRLLYSAFLFLSLEYAIGELSRDKIHLYKIKDVDFLNTKVERVCLLAEFDAIIVLTHKFSNGSNQEYSLVLPQDATTVGSFCNNKYISRLQLNFHGNSLIFEFARNKIDIEIHEATYCNDCNYGNWYLNQIIGNFSFMGDIIHGTSNVDQLRKGYPGLTNGIGIKRAFKCNKDDNLITLPIHIDQVTHASNGEVGYTDEWQAEIRFFLIHVQPFLVYKEHFSDPYLCRDVTASHVLVILLPLIYFAIFILFYRVKQAYGCPPKRMPWSWKGKMKTGSPSDTKFEIEESANIISGEFTSIQAPCYSDSE
uniref:uncharacterized protein LOC120341594 n=1 Tax=Styela clava TaxID=7725 RepID=UPI001939D9E7|nr:uncharacterized protein LOC120341594 [Styela clava]